MNSFMYIQNITVIINQFRTNISGHKHGMNDFWSYKGRNRKVLELSNEKFKTIKNVNLLFE